MKPIKKILLDLLAAALLVVLLLIIVPPDAAYAAEASGEKSEYNTLVDTSDADIVVVGADDL